MAAKRAIEMIDRDGNVVKTYNSVHAAARDNYMSAQTVVYKCTGRIKNPFKNYEYSFRYKE